MLNKDSKTVHMLSEFKGYGNTVGILAYYNVYHGSISSPIHLLVISMLALTPIS